MQNARETALKILHKIDTNGAYSNIALKDELSCCDLDYRDKAFVTNIVYGVISRKITLDYILQSYSSMKLKKLSTYVLEILRMGIFQMFFMDRVPQSAAVNECVKLAHKYAHRSNGFVNAVLRNAARGGDILSGVEDISIKYSFPPQICDMFVNQLGYERAVSVMDALNGESTVTVRANILKTDGHELLTKLNEQGVKAEVIDGMPNALHVSGMDVAKNELYRNGFFTVQGIAAMLSVMALDVREGQNVIDMCAAPGGKTSYICELMRNKGSVRAFDVHEHKLKLVDNSMKRLGIDIVKTEYGDGCEFNDELDCSADRVLADVPCSGLGIITKKPDIKWAFERSGLNIIQMKILSNAARYLKPGGELVYSTCTLNKAENDDIINEFLSENSGYELVDFNSLIPEGFRKETNGYITLYPDTDKTDGFFIAKIRRKI